MKNEKLATINLKGKDYVMVNTRVEYFNQAFPNGNISTSYDVVGDSFIFKATVTPDTEHPTRFFNGTSYGKVNNEKALEKLETVAVGRALAFMGIGIVEGIASADEIEKFHEPVIHADAQEPFSKGLDMHTEEQVLCEECGNIMVYKTGEKNGKVWKGYFCPTKGHQVKWVK